MADEFNKENGGYTDGSAFQQNQGSANESAGTGNGSYNYNQGEYHNTYSNAYGSNQSHRNASNGYGQNNYGGTGDNRPKKGKGKAGKAAFAILLAVIVGASAGVGAWGINKVAGNQSGRNEASANLQIDPEDGKQEQSEDTQKSGTGDSSAQSSEKSESGSSAQLSMNDSQAVVTDVSKVVDKVMPSMVSVYNNFTQTRQDFFGQTYSQQSQATGSGIIIGKTDTELLIVTNNHVVADADSLQVQFQDENTADASIKGTDETNDLAVIAVKLSDIKDDTMSKISIATLGNSDNLVLGEPVVAIGNALGYGQSVTTGVVSALNREITQENNETGTFIQTDAAINPGNSGGALVDLNGNVIGINSSKIGGSTVEGMGYAIPISKAEPIIESLMNQTTKEKVSEDKQGYLGISGVSVTSQVSSAYNMPQGVYVAKVISGTGAADSDLKKGVSAKITHRWRNLGWGYLPNNIRQWNHKYKVAFALINADGKVAQLFIDDQCEPSEWRQGTPMAYTFEVKADVKAGLYLWAVSIVDTTQENAPGIRLAVANLSKTEDGWIKLANVEVK